MITSALHVFENVINLQISLKALRNCANILFWISSALRTDTTALGKFNQINHVSFVRADESGSCPFALIRFMTIKIIYVTQRGTIVCIHAVSC